MRDSFLLPISGVREGGKSCGCLWFSPPFLLGVFSQSSLRCCGSQGQGRKHMTALQGLVEGLLTDGVGRGQGSTRRQVTVGAVTTGGLGVREGAARAGRVGGALQGMSLQRSTASVRTTAQQGASLGDSHSCPVRLPPSDLPLVFWGQIQLEAREQDSWGGAL